MIELSDVVLLYATPDFRPKHFEYAIAQAAVFFRYRPAGEQQWQETEKQTVTSADAFQYELSGLTPGTEYEYAAVIQSGDVERVGSLKSFVTTFGQEDGF